jgi:hypothetical protein
LLSIKYCRESEVRSSAQVPSNPPPSYICEPSKLSICKLNKVSWLSRSRRIPAHFNTGSKSPERESFAALPSSILRWAVISMKIAPIKTGCCLEVSRKPRIRPVPRQCKALRTAQDAPSADLACRIPAFLPVGCLRVCARKASRASLAAGTHARGDVYKMKPSTEVSVLINPVQCGPRLRAVPGAFLMEVSREWRRQLEESDKRRCRRHRHRHRDRHR